MLALTQNHLEKAIKQAYLHSENLSVSLDSVPHLISEVNPATKNLDFGIVFTLQTANKEYHYVVFHLIETSDGYILSDESAGICTSITCLKCKKPLFADCVCKSGEGECYKRGGEETDLSSAFKLAL